MKIINNLRAKWQEKTTAEKIKTVIEGVCNFGADLLMGYLNMRLIPQDEKKWKKAACVITSGGLGMALGAAASKQINDIVDAFADAKKEDPDA